MHAKASNQAAAGVRAEDGPEGRGGVRLGLVLTSLGTAAADCAQDRFVVDWQLAPPDEPPAEP